MEDSIDGDDPIYLTYYMIDWNTINQSPSGDSCVACGGTMLKIAPVRNKAGRAYEGRVCHSCKTLLWVMKNP